MDWSLLTDACGPADHLPALLERFAADPAARWPELMDHLCPQLDTAYPASWAALPRLAQIAAAHDGTTHAVPVRPAETDQLDGPQPGCTSGSSACPDCGAGFGVVVRPV
ncbi:hypothetical protein [Kitasatospora sp. NPDC048407]|uniref:hypothetical protein n=1 Tax=Kitasatospora sp. NPDC048407 TaxID=3364051 RepID=UPI003723062E